LSPWILPAAHEVARNQRQASPAPRSARRCTVATLAGRRPASSTRALRDSETLLIALGQFGFLYVFGIPVPALWRYGWRYERQFPRKAVGSLRLTYCLLEPVGGLEPPTY
jgi:hypothetical protein